MNLNWSGDVGLETHITAGRETGGTFWLAGRRRSGFRLWQVGPRLGRNLSFKPWTLAIYNPIERFADFDRS